MYSSVQLCALVYSSVKYCTVVGSSVQNLLYLRWRMSARGCSSLQDAGVKAPLHLHHPGYRRAGISAGVAGVRGVGCRGVLGPVWGCYGPYGGMGVSGTEGRLEG